MVDLKEISDELIGELLANYQKPDDLLGKNGILEQQGEFEPGTYPAKKVSMEPDRDWQRYAERAVNYAFGVPGDLWLVSRAEERRQEEEQKKREDEVQQQETPQEAPRLRFR